MSFHKSISAVSALATSVLSPALTVLSPVQSVLNTPIPTAKLPPNSADYRNSSKSAGRLIFRAQSAGR